MNDDRKNGSKQDDDHELTFESGYGAQDKVLEGDETLEDVAGVSEADIREDVKPDKDREREKD